MLEGARASAELILGAGDPGVDSGGKGKTKRVTGGKRWREEK